jgi:Tol biopolymer transport system component
MCSISRLPRAVSCLALLASLVISSSAFAAGQNKIVYDQFDWKTYSSTHFRVYHYGREKETLQKVTSLAESAYDELSRRLNYQIPKPIPLIYYASHAEFEQNNIILNFIPEGVGAFAEPAKNRMVLPIDLPDEKLQALIQHELTHVFEYEILFGGKLGRALTSNIPTWFMEGLASYFGNDEDEKDRIFIRDAVNSALIPPITKVQIEGYPAYRYGHAVFSFIESEWGKDAVREFVFEFRSFLGRDITATLKKSFDVDADEFDLRFRRYLRRTYLPLLAAHGEASEYGQRLRVGELERPSFEVGAAPSPSGDFVATLTTWKGNVDIALVGVKSRKVWKKLTAGGTTKYEYLSAQFLTMGPENGRDLSFAPDGDRIAVFARRERGRQLFVFSARSGSVIDRISVSADMPISPSFSPDGRFVLFSGIERSSRDIFLLDLETKKARNLTNDAAYDTAPVFSPDGKWIYHAKIVGGKQRIVRFPLEDPSKVESVVWSDGNDDDPALSPDGKRLYFCSSRGGGIPNVYSQDLTTGEVLQFTEVIGAALGPAAFIGPDGHEKVVFSGYQGQRMQLYVADAGKPIRKLGDKAAAPTSLAPESVASYVPAVEVTIDAEKVKPVPKFKLFLDDAQAIAGINSDQTFVSLIQLGFSDYLGDKRAFFTWESVAGYSNFRLGYFNLAHRLQLGITAYDVREYFVGVSTIGEVVQDRRFMKETGIFTVASWPFSRYSRVEGSLGFISRTLDVPYIVTNADGSQVQGFEARSDNDPAVGLAFSYDTTRYASFGPQGGHRIDLGFQYVPDLKDGGTLTRDMTLDARLYVPISRRSNLAFRFSAARSDGNAPTVYYFGGLDTLRGYDFRTLIGNRVFYLNSEFRFPLIDLLATGIGIQGVRGRIFLDLGGAWLKDQPFQFWDGENGQLKDGRASYGAGFSIFFLGLPWNFDFAKQWDFKQTTGGTQTEFYVGWTF